MRNPDYDPATDTPEARENFVDRFEWRINTNNDDIYNRVEAGLIEDEIATETPPVLKHYSEDEELSPSLHASSGDRTWYITMNLTRPPFDDVHVRKAVNFVLDKQALRLAWGGPITGEIGTHIVPDPIFDDELKGYDPYATPDSRGDVEAAKAEMSQSRYDTDGDGLCDAPECSNIVHITGDAASRQQMIPVIEEGLRQIGIEVRTRTLADSYSVIQTGAEHPDLLPAGLGQGLRRRLHVLLLPLQQPDAHTDRQLELLLVGLTPEQATELGATGSIEDVPSVDGGHRRVRRTVGRRAPRLLRGPRQEADGGDRALGSVPLREQHPDHRARCREVGLRPVQRHDRLRPRGRRP